MGPRDTDRSNPFCKRSFISGDEYEYLVITYFLEALFAVPRSSIHELYHFFIGLGSYGTSCGNYISGYSLGVNFQKISQYIWENIVANLCPWSQEKRALDELLGFIYGETVKLSPYYLELYLSIDAFSPQANSNNFEKSLMYYLLSRRSKRAKGFRKDKFYLEFSRVFLICYIIKSRKMELESVSSILKKETYEKLLYDLMKFLFYFLEQNPIGSPPMSNQIFQNMIIETNKKYTVRQRPRKRTMENFILWFDDSSVSL